MIRAVKNAVFARVPLAAGLTALYLLITGNAEPSNFAVAAVLGVGLSLLLPPPETRRSARDWPRIITAFVVHSLTVAWDVLVNGLLVASLVLWRRSRVRPGPVRIRNGHSTEMAAALDAHAVSLSPGQLVLKIEPDHYTAHCLLAPEVRAEGPDAGATRRARIERFAGSRDAAGKEAD